MKNGPPAVHRRREERRELTSVPLGMNCKESAEPEEPGDSAERAELGKPGRIAGSAEAAGVNGLIAVAELLELDGGAEAEKDIGRA